MAASKIELLQGTLDLLILRTLTLREDHGVGIARRIQQITKGAFEAKPGSLFPALHRLEEKCWLASAWGESGNRRPAEYQPFTKARKKQPACEIANWEGVPEGVSR